jgi:HK97 family phage major capsid protein
MELELKDKVETALNGLETFKSELVGKLDKMDGFDKQKFENVVAAVGTAAEATEAHKAKLAAIEAGQTELKASLKQIEAAFNRVPNGGDMTNEQKASALAKKQNKLFNAFARNNNDGNKISLDVFLAKAMKDDAELKALSVGSDPDGGYTVMPTFGGIMVTKIFESSPIRQLATVTPISSDSLEIVVDYDEAAAEWVSEAGTRATTATPVFGKIDIATHEMSAKPKVTQKLLDDSIIDVESWLMGKVAEKFARKEATAFVAGTGVGQPKGLASYTAGTTISSGQIEQVNSGNASTLTRTGLVNIQNALKEPYQTNATWLTQRASLATIMEMKNGIGDPIFDSMFDKNVGLELTIMGRPLRFAADVAAISSSALAVIYGDIRAAYQIVDRIGLRILRDPYTAHPFVQFMCSRRVGGGVVNFEAVKIQKISA